MPQPRRASPLYQEIYSKLKASIEQGEYRAGDMLPSERKMREMFGACHLTIRRALGKLVDDGSIERRSGVGTVVSKAGGGAAARAAGRRIRSLAVILEDVDAYFSRIIGRLESSCRTRGLRVVLHCHHRDPVVQQQQLAMAAADSDAMIVLFPASPDNLSSHGALARTVVVDEEGLGLDSPQVVSDDIDGMYHAVKYLADLGHRAIGHISSESKTTGRNRLAGFHKAVGELRLDGDQGLVENGSYLLESSYFACEKLLERRPDLRAIVCANDYAAFGAMKSLRKRGLTPGTDFSLIGYGNYDISEVLGLTSVDQRTGSICDQVMFLVDEYASGRPLKPGVCRIPTELRIRGSCCRAGSQRGNV